MQSKNDQMTATITMPINDIDVILKSTGSQIGYCKFQKSNGAIRKMWFKNISPKYIVGKNGKGPVYSAKEKKLTPVFDVKSHGIRTIKWDSVLEIGIKGKKYSFYKLHDGDL